MSHANPMTHLNIVFRGAGTRERTGHKRREYLNNGSPTLCSGCQKLFPLRDGNREAQVGQDGRLYCYNMTHKCAVLAVVPAPLSRAS